MRDATTVIATTVLLLTYAHVAPRLRKRFVPMLGLPFLCIDFIVHHKVKTTGFSRSALAARMSRKSVEAAWNTGTVVTRYIRLSTTLYG